MNELLNKMTSRTVYGTMAASVVLLCLATYLYVFKEPLKEYKLLQGNSRLLEAKVNSGGLISGKLAGVESEIEALTKRLQGQTPMVSNSKMVAHVINGLDIISSKHAIRFLGLRPAAPGTVKYFEELPFAIEVSGNYFSLIAWLQEVERELGPMVVKKISMEPLPGKGEQVMRLSMVSYRLKW